MSKAGRFAFFAIFVAFASGAPSLPGPQSRNPAVPANLDELLKKTWEYCVRLDQIALYFTCIEEVSEKVHQPYLDMAWGPGEGGSINMISSTITNSSTATPESASGESSFKKTENPAASKTRLWAPSG